MKPIWIMTVASFQESVRNRWVIAGTAMLACLSFVLALIGSAPIGETRVGPIQVTAVSLASLSAYMIPLLALTLSFDTVVGELERGTLPLLLTYPCRRWQVIVGKFAGLWATVVLAVVVGYGVTAVYIFLSAGEAGEGWWQYAKMVSSSLLLGAVFISLGILLSTSVRVRAMAVGGALLIWIVIVIVYDLLLLGIVVGEVIPDIGEQWVNRLVMINPVDAYRLLNLSDAEAGALVSGSAGILPMHGGGGGLWILTGWVVTPLLLSIALFSNKEV